MDTDIVIALIGLVGAIAGAAITATITTFGHEIISVITGQRGTNKDLLGRWKCQWTTRGEKDVIVDSVDLVKVAGERIKATANNAEYGNYVISGRVTPSGLITMHYEGQGDKRPLGGVVLLDLNASRRNAKGVWHELSASRKIVGGSTIWEKEPL